MLARRTDSNQTDIVDALRKAGVSVAITSHVGSGFPDLVCGRIDAEGIPRAYLLEVKTEGERLTPRQAIWHQLWNGHVAIVKSVDEALAAVGVSHGLTDCP